jgi:hypothetical protein
MSEMYEYFEDFPEENPANYVGEYFNPEGAKRLRAEKARLQQEQAALDAEIQGIIEKARESIKRKNGPGQL